MDKDSKDHRAAGSDRPGSSEAEILGWLRESSTATVNHLLFNQGYGETCFEGVHPLQPLGGERLVGRAVTVRYLPGRPDRQEVRKRWASGEEPLLRAIESLSPGKVLVVDALGRTNCGVLGDILIGRIAHLQAEAVAVDGAVRDAPILADMGFPVFSRGVHPAATKQLFAYEWNVPVSCGGALVCPGDYILCDGEGAVAVPAAIAGEIARAAVETEALEGIARECILEGALIEEVYPPGPHVKALYEARRRDEAKAAGE